MRILLFDLWDGGHNHLYFDRFARALEGHEVVVAAPARVLERLDPSTGVTTIATPLVRGAPPVESPGAAWGVSAEAERALIGRICEEVRPDRFVHMWADHLLEHWRAEATPCPAAFIVFFPTAHYPERFGAKLTEAELASATALERAVAACRGLPTTCSMMTLAPFAAEAWQARPGAPALWLPEPPVSGSSKAEQERSVDVGFFGVLAQRKGLHWLAAAIEAGLGGVSVAIAGWIEQPGHRPEVMRLVERMQGAGARVELALEHHTEQQGLDFLARARCVVLPYPRHFGMSRVLLEAASVGTPVVAHDFGLLGHLVRSRGLGAVVDCADSGRFARAIAEVITTSAQPGLRQNCRQYAQELTFERFYAVVREAVIGRIHGEAP